jgi:hypothetical protein
MFMSIIDCELTLEESPNTFNYVKGRLFIKDIIKQIENINVAD